jgi:hypothetical protein
MNFPGGKSIAHKLLFYFAADGNTTISPGSAAEDKIPQLKLRDALKIAKLTRAFKPEKNLFSKDTAEKNSRSGKKVEPETANHIKLPAVPEQKNGD